MAEGVLMMKAITIIVSALVLGASAAFAQVATDDPFRERAAVTDFRASELMGATVYVSDAAIVTTSVEGVPEAWESVANVDDLVTTMHGEIRGVLIDVGGFLGIGARTVMVDMDALHVVHERDANAVHVVLNATREALENAPEFDEGSIARQYRTDFDGRVGVPAVPPTGFEHVAPRDLTADDLMNAEVYDRFDERVAGISDVVLSSDGAEVEAVLVDVGGFLGLFTHTVLVDIDQLDVQSDAERNQVRVYLDLSEEQLEALPEHGG
jgi:hypothetical protein